MPLPMRRQMPHQYLVGTQTRHIVIERDPREWQNVSNRSAHLGQPLSAYHTKVLGWDKKDGAELVWY